MPGLVQKNAQIGGIISSSGTVSENGIWSKHRGDVTFDQLQKFWNELSPQARQELLRIDKQTLFEQARKNLYCSRCNGLLLEGFSQIVMYGKSLYHEGTVQSTLVVDEVQDPSIHPWGGLATTRDGILTLLDCFLDGKSLKALQNVFDSARARERERELLYPDACGGGGRGWISQGVPNYGRGHGARETCALHTARFSCDTLVDFWLALGDESRQSLLRMKEEDFIERLMYRFDSKRFCRDCRRNVIREFKELKELKRIHREPHCTNWFCAADTAFQYEVSDDAIQADWGQSFIDAIGTYHHFEWAVGTGEGNSDILEFEDVGMNQSVQVNGLDLGDLISCFITLRAWKLDGRCTELSVKAHALKGKPCVHRRLIVGDGFVTITKGESITRFFEHAEEAEEEEDDDSIEKDGNDADGDGSRAQKHAKTPELAREFLLDAATVIFRDQVEKAFREGTARQNAHSIFVCLALKLLEERVHVACKEIITLEKQIKLLEEEEKEKREEEERKERRRTKEREKKHRRKERQKGKDKGAEPKQLSSASDLSGKESSLSAHMEPHYGSNSGDSIGEIGENILSSPVSSDIVDTQLLNEFQHEILENDSLEHHSYHVDRDFNVTDDSSYLLSEQQLKFSQRKTRFRKDLTTNPVYRWSDRRNSLVGNEASFQVDESKSRSHAYVAISSRCNDGIQRQSKNHITKSNARSCGPKSGENFRTSSNKMRDRSDFHSCSCNQHCGYRSKEGLHVRSGRDSKMANKLDMGLDVSTRSFSRSTKFTHGCYGPDGCAILRGKILTSNTPSNKGEIHYKKVWEPMESRKKCSRSSSEPDVRLRSSDGSVNGFHKSNEVHNSTDEKCSSESSGNLGKADELDNYEDKKGAEESNIFSASSLENSCSDVYGLATKLNYYLNGAVEEEGLCSTISSDPVMSSSSSDNCSSCHSEGDSNTASSGAQNAESLCTSDSEDASQHSECREISTCTESPLVNSVDVSPDEKLKTYGQGSFTSGTISGMDSNLVAGQPLKNGLKSANGRVVVDMGALQPHLLPVHNQNVPLPVFSAPSTMGYYHQSPASWELGHTNGLVPFPQLNRFVYTGPVDNALSVNQLSHFCVQYGETTQPMTAPAFNVDQLPLYHVSNKVNCVNTNEQTRISKLGRAQRATSMTATIVSEHRPKGAAVNRAIQQKVPSSRQNGNPSKPQDGSPKFSLFHFGGPVAISMKDEGIADLSSEWTGAPLHVDRACSKKEAKVEEYSLFASSKGSRFSFF